MAQFRENGSSLPPHNPEQGSPQEGYSPDKKPGLFSRRGMFKLAAGVLGAEVAYDLYPTLKREARRATISTQEMETNIKERKQSLEQKYNFAIEFTPPNGKVKNFKGITMTGYDLFVFGEEAPLLERGDALVWLENFLNTYPEEFLEHSKITRVIIIKDLSSSMTKSGEDALKNKKNIAGLALADGVIVIDCGACIIADGKEEATFKEDMHHEFFHIAESRERSLENMDKEWLGLNPNGVDAYLPPSILLKRYGLDKAKDILEKHEGFINIYSMSNELEDRAEVGAWLMAKGEKLSEMAKRDPVLAAKVKNIKNKYSNWSNGKMDERYWKKTKK